MFRIIALLALALGLSLSCDKEEKNPVQYPPAAPNLLAAVEVTYNFVHLTWNDQSDNEERFELEKGLGGEWVLEAEYGINAHEAIVEDLAPGTMYQFRVYAVNTEGRSAASNTLTVSTLQFNPPPAPTNVQATAIVPTVVRITWTDTAPNPVVFVIDRHGQSDSWVRVGETGDNATSFNDSTCAPLTLLLQSRRACGITAYMVGRQRRSPRRKLERRSLRQTWRRRLSSESACA
ncbi:MAG: fibronectin type III domain-containing protein [bacterium]|nr:fibronectin type III domain-containing protein [bacterium]